MLRGRVIGKVVATHKYESLQGMPLLLVQVIDHRGKPSGEPKVATDRIGVGPGEEVLLELSKEAGLGLPRARVPTDLGIVAKVDCSTVIDES